MSLSIVPRHQALHRVRLVGARSATWSVVTGAHQCPAAASSDKTPLDTPSEARGVVIRIVPAKLPRRLAQPIRSQMPRGKLRSPRRDPSYAPICGDHRATPNASEPPISDTVGENAPETPQLYTVHVPTHVTPHLLLRAAHKRRPDLPLPQSARKLWILSQVTRQKLPRDSPWERVHCV